MTNDDMRKFKDTVIKLLEDDKLKSLSDKIEAMLVEIPVGTLDDEAYPPEDIVVNCSNAAYEDVILRDLQKENYENVLHSFEKSNNCRVVYAHKDRVKSYSFIRERRLIVAFIMFDEVKAYTSLFEYILSEILKNLLSVSELEKIVNSDGRQEELLGGFQRKWVLMGKFAEYLLSKMCLPKSEILIELSAARYEGSDSEARIYFTDQELETIEKFSAIGKETRRICSDNLRMIRKLIEISKRNTVYLFAERKKDSKGEFFEVTRLVRLRKEETKQERNESDIYIKFSGFMHWSIICGQKEELSYYHGMYKYNNSVEDKQYEEDIEKLKNVDKDMIKSLVEVIKKQTHGTSVIISDFNGNIKATVDRLCKLNRGIRISSEIRYHPDECMEKRWDKEQILSITGIDGALLMDLSGRCLAIGVLVDGIATIKGNVGRGARFNCIENYVRQKEEGNYIGIIVSEDGMINIIQNNIKIS